MPISHTLSLKRVNELFRMANDSIQANLKPATVERIAKIADKPVTRGIDKMINKCIDELEKRNCSENKVKSESENE